MNKGKFIVIDGTDGSGKATQTRLLVKRLTREGYRVHEADFPQYGTKSAGAVEEYLNGKYGYVDPDACSVLYAVDRFDASFTIKKKLEQGMIVVSNRYVTANAGHQGGKIKTRAERQKYFKWLNNLEFGIFKIPKPDLNLILHVSAKTAQLLVDKKDAAVRTYAGGKKRDLHEADLNHLKNAEKVYLELAKSFPRTRLIECEGRSVISTIETIHEKIWKAVQKLLERR